MVDVEEEKKKTGEIIEVVIRESADAARESEIAAVQEANTIEATENAKKEKAGADAELAEAIPAMERATDAVNCLKVEAVQELKALGKPPDQCVIVAKAVLILKNGEKKNYEWTNA